MTDAKRRQSRSRSGGGHRLGNKVKSNGKLNKNETMFSQSDEEQFSDEAERMAAEIDEDVPIIKGLNLKRK